MTSARSNQNQTYQASRRQSFLALGGLALAALALICATLALAVRADAVAPALGSVALGPLSLTTTIENRICLQRVLKHSCSAPLYTVRLGLESGASVRYYQLLSLPISERYAFYP